MENIIKFPFNFWHLHVLKYSFRYFEWCTNWYKVLSKENYPKTQKLKFSKILYSCLPIYKFLSWMELVISESLAKDNIFLICAFKLPSFKWLIDTKWAKYFCWLASTKYFCLSDMYKDMLDRHQMCTWSVRRDTYWGVGSPIPPQCKGWGVSGPPCPSGRRQKVKLFVTNIIYRHQLWGGNQIWNNSP